MSCQNYLRYGSVVLAQGWCQATTLPLAQRPARPPARPWLTLSCQVCQVSGRGEGLVWVVRIQAQALPHALTLRAGAVHRAGDSTTMQSVLVAVHIWVQASLSCTAPVHSQHMQGSQVLTMAYKILVNAAAGMPD